MTDAWEYNKELDTPKSYHAFCLYRDLGPMRSIERAYELYKGRKDGVKKARTPGFFEKWAASAQWDSRSNLFDLHQEKERRVKQSIESRLAYEARLETIRDDIESIAIARLEFSKIAAYLALSVAEDLRDGVELRFTRDNLRFLLDAAKLQSLEATSIETALKITDEALDIRGILEKQKGG